MAAGPQDLEIDGTDTVSVVYEDDDGAPIDLTGFDVRVQVRSGYLPGGTLYATLGTAGGESGVTVPDPPTGEILIAFDRAALAAAGVPVGRPVVWEVVVYTDDGVARLLRGSLRLSKVVVQVP